MKKLLSISLIVVISFAALSFTTPKTTSIVEPVKSEKIELTNDDEALYCSVTIGTRTVTCWFCDCAGLATTLIANQ